jgi:hypothetical protein
VLAAVMAAGCSKSNTINTVNNTTIGQACVGAGDECGTGAWGPATARRCC